MIDSISSLDNQITLFFNGSDYEYVDHAMLLATSTWTWIPVGIVLLFICFRNLSRTQFWEFIAVFALIILCSDWLSDDVFKPYFARLRPSQDPELSPYIDIVDNYRGGRYGFFSAHASNTMSVALLFMRVIRDRILSGLLLVWVLLNCYTRLYLGVHFFGDITVGLCFGVIWGLLFSSIYLKVAKLKPQQSTPFFTSTGFSKRDVRIAALFVIASFAVVFVAPLFYSF